MIYVSVDLETSCLVRKPENTLSAGLMMEDTNQSIHPSSLPKLSILFLQDYIDSHPVALEMNKEVLEDRRKAKDMLSAGQDPMLYRTLFSDWYDLIVSDWQEAIPRIKEWMESSAKSLDPEWYLKYCSKGVKMFGAGKNFASFDLQFFPQELKDLFNHRSLDPGSMFFNPWDEQIPDSKECLIRAGLDSNVAHKAMRDAEAVIMMIRSAKPSRFRLKPGRSWLGQLFGWIRK
jgi:hypothetical protein